MNTNTSQPNEQPKDELREKAKAIIVAQMTFLHDESTKIYRLEEIAASGQAIAALAQAFAVISNQ